MSDSTATSILVLHNIAKKKNFGELIRTAAAMGVVEIVVVGAAKLATHGCHGTAAHVKFSHFTNFKDACAYLRNVRKVTLCGVEITPEAQPVQKHPFRGPTAFLMGNEGQGLTPAQLEACEQFVYIPQHSGATASLNVNAACAVVLHHFAQWAELPEAPREGYKYNVDDDNRPQCVAHSGIGLKQMRTLNADGTVAPRGRGGGSAEAADVDGGEASDENAAVLDAMADAMADAEAMDVPPVPPPDPTPPPSPPAEDEVEVVQPPTTLDTQPSDVLHSVCDALYQRVVVPPCFTLEEAWDRKKAVVAQQQQRAQAHAGSRRKNFVPPRIPTELPPVLMRDAPSDSRRAFEEGMRALLDLLAFARVCHTFHAASRQLVESARHSLLRSLAHNGDLDSLRELLAHGPCDVNIADVHGYTALMLACSNGHIYCARWLLLYGADADLLTHSGKSARDLGGYESEEPFDVDVETLLDECSGEGVTRAKVVGSCLFAAMDPFAGTGFADFKQLLSDPDCAVDVTNKEGQTLLAAACRVAWSMGNQQRLRPDFVRLLLEKGAPVDQADARYGDTPLMTAVANGLVDCVQMLRDAGADPDIKDRDGHTALDILARSNVPEDVRGQLLAVLHAGTRGAGR